MDSDFGVLLADLTSSGDESLDQLLVPDDDLGYHVVGNGGVFLLFQWNTAEPGCKWFASVATFHAGLETFTWPVRRVDDGVVLRRHLPCRRAVLPGQGP